MVLRQAGLLAMAICLAQAGIAETYEEYVARHQRVQKMMNPLNVPVANVMNDAWNEYPDYADPRNKPAPKKGPKDFYIKSSRDEGRLKTR